MLCSKGACGGQFADKTDFIGQNEKEETTTITKSAAYASLRATT
jgi:hypothetical protein